MSLAALKTLANTFAGIGAVAKGDKTPAKTFRKFSKYAKHRVFLNREQIKLELADLIYRGLGYDITEGEYNWDNPENTPDYIFTNEDLEKLTTLIIDNVVTAFKEISKRIESSNRGIITIYYQGSGTNAEVHVFSQTNNFRLIGESFEKAWAGKGQTGNFKRFIINSLDKNSPLVENIKNERAGTGVHVAHGRSTYEDISNIEHFINVIGINALRVTIDSDLKDLIEKEIVYIENDLRAVLGNPQGLRELHSVLQSLGLITISSKSFDELMQTYIDTTIKLVKKVTLGSATLELSAEQKIVDPEGLRAGALDIAIDTRFGSAWANMLKGATTEAALGRLTAERNRELFKFIEQWLSGDKEGTMLVTQGSGKGKTKKFAFPPIPPMHEGSQTLFNMMGDTVYESLQYGKSKNRSTVGTARKPAKPEKVKVKNPIKVGSAPPIVSKKPKPTYKNIIRNNSNKSIINIINLINMQLEEQLKENMVAPALIYRTGNFAKSAKIIGQSMDRDGYMRLQYTYQKYPYQVFEVGHQKGTPARDPRKLISKSIRELAVDMVMAKLRIVRV